MRYRLRTLLILLGVMPPVLAGSWFVMQSVEALIALTGLTLLFSIVAIPSSILFALTERRRCLLDRDRGERLARPKSNLFSDGWPISD